MKDVIDTGSLIVVFITLLLFTIALFVKGFTHDLLLEAGVFLVSVKLIIMSYQNSRHTQSIKNELSEIKGFIQNK